VQGAVVARRVALGARVLGALALLHLLDVVLVVENLDVAASWLVRHIGQRAHLAGHLEIELFGLDLDISAASLVLHIFFGAHLGLSRVLEVQLLCLDFLGTAARFVGGVLQGTDFALGAPLEFGGGDFLIAASWLVGVVFSCDARRRLREVDLAALDFHPAPARFVVRVLQGADLGAHHLQIGRGRLPHLDLVHGQFFALLVRVGGEARRAGAVGFEGRGGGRRLAGRRPPRHGPVSGHGGPPGTDRLGGPLGLRRRGLAVAGQGWRLLRLTRGLGHDDSPVFVFCCGFVQIRAQCERNFSSWWLSAGSI